MNTCSSSPFFFCSPAHNKKISPHRTAIVLLNAKSAMLGKYYLLAYQKLQYQYVLNTSQPIILYYYGKYICACTDETIRKHFICSGISALQECLRSCYSSRHGKIAVSIFSFLCTAPPTPKRIVLVRKSLHPLGGAIEGT